MDCDRFREALVLKRYGEGSPDPALEEHLAACAACRETLEDMAELSAMYREASAEPLPLRLRERVLHLRKPAPRFLVPLAAAAAFAAVFLAGHLREQPGLADPAPSGAADVLVLQLTPAEREEIRKFRYAPESWERESFAAESVEQIKEELERLERSSFWDGGEL